MNEIKLKPCAHCGRNEIISLEGFAWCNDCGYDLPLKKWNTRANGWRRVEDGLPPQTGQYLLRTTNGYDVDTFHAPSKKWHCYGKTQYGDTSKSIIEWKVID
jgi:hypothetical protein